FPASADMAVSCGTIRRAPRCLRALQYESTARLKGTPRRTAMFRLIGCGVIGLLLSAAAAQDITDPLAGKQFRSLDKHEVGLGPKGVELGYWSLSFKGGTFSWRHSDVVESGKYEYNAKTGEITGRPRAGKLVYRGNYDAKTGVLTWEKVKYKQPPAK